MGFTETKLDDLDRVFRWVKEDLPEGGVGENRRELTEYWNEEDLLLPKSTTLPSIANGIHFSLECLIRLEAMGFRTRLVICLDELNQGRCLCEASSADGKESYYFDHRREQISPKQGLIGYTFFSISPWNPLPCKGGTWVSVAI